MTFTVTTQIATLGFTDLDQALDAAASLARNGFSVTMGYVSEDEVMATAGLTLAEGLRALV